MNKCNLLERDSTRPLKHAHFLSQTLSLSLVLSHTYACTHARRCISHAQLTELALQHAKASSNLKMQLQEAQVSLMELKGTQFPTRGLLSRSRDRPYE